MKLYRELSLGAQTAYAELQDQLRTQNIGELSALPGSFQRLIKRGNPYIYYNFRDIDGTQRMAYVDPEDERVQQLIAKTKTSKAESGATVIQAQNNSALALGCMSTLTKHFRVINRLGQYGIYRAGGILIGTHAFLAMGNMLGVKWTSSDRTMEVDFAHAGKNVSVALGANLKLSVHDALTSLDVGACIVNIPAPQRYAIHKLIIYGERPLTERVKAKKDLGQAASIIQVLLDMGRTDLVKAAWFDALSRGPGWKKEPFKDGMHF